MVDVLILVCFVLATLCWFALRDSLRSARLRHALKASCGGCCSAFKCMCDVMLFKEDK